MNNILGFQIPGEHIVFSDIITAILFAGLVAFISFRFKFLTKSGIVTTFILAVIIYGLGTWKWTIPMFIFFFFSSIISKLREKRNKNVDTFFEKSGQRDYMQVISNGGFAGLLIIINYFFPSPMLYAAYVSSISAVCADTWGTEIGTMSQNKTYNILTFKKVEQGSSGGVSFTGLTGALWGSLIISLSSLLWIFDNSYIFVLIILFAGFIASIIDSILGAALQAKYQCIICTKPTEKEVHCNEQTIKIKGYSLVNNDVVNIIAGISGGLLGYILSDIILY